MTDDKPNNSINYETGMRLFGAPPQNTGHQIDVQPPKQGGNHTYFVYILIIAIAVSIFVYEQSKQSSFEIPLKSTAMASKTPPLLSAVIKNSANNNAPQLQNTARIQNAPQTQQNSTAPPRSFNLKDLRVN